MTDHSSWGGEYRSRIAEEEARREKSKFHPFGEHRVAAMGAGFNKADRLAA